MCRCSAVMKALIFLILSLHPSSAVTHTLQYLYTAVTLGINVPQFTVVGLVDGQEFEYYDSDLRNATPKTEWIQKVTVNETDSWNRHTELYQSWQKNFETGLYMVMEDFNHIKGVHTLQLMYGCELDDDGTTRRHAQLGYDGEDFLSLDLKTKTWISAKHGAEISKKILNYINGLTTEGYVKNYVSTTCIQRIKQYVSYGRETLERKVRPEVSVFHRHSSPSPEVVCHATGFFPKPLNITWQKDGEDVHEDVELRETLPNQDGSFQKRSILKVPAEELQKHTYTCVVQHSSLEKELVRKPKGGGSDRGSAGRFNGEGSDKGSGGGSVGPPNPIIAAVVVSLVIFAAVVAVIVVWKKKNSGGRRKEPDVKFSQNGSRTISSLSFMPVPQKNPDSVDTLKRMYSCEQNGDGTTRGYDHYTYNGDDIISLNQTTGT